MPTYNFPTSYKIETIERIKLPRRVADSPLLSIMPFDSTPETFLLWEQGDLYRGFQQWRGLNNRPLTVSRVGSKRYFAEPGVYGEKIILNEDELTNRRAKAAQSQPGGPVDIGDLVMEAHEQLLDRRLTLITKIIADYLVGGSFTVSDINGNTVYRGSYTRQQVTPAVAWNLVNTAMPLKDMIGYRELELGQDVVFDESGVQLMTSKTWSFVQGNLNANDLFGKRVGGGNTINSVADLNQIFLQNGVPPIRIWNDGYFRESDGAFTKFIPDGKVLVVGKRKSGARVGSYRFTRNINAPGAAPAPYVRVRVEDDVPSHVEVHDGHNGGPVLQYPGTLIVVNAY